MERLLLLREKIRIMRAIDDMPKISLYDEDGEVNDDAYQDKLEQQEYKRELYEELDIIQSQLNQL